MWVEGWKSLDRTIMSTELLMSNPYTLQGQQGRKLRAKSSQELEEEVERLEKLVPVRDDVSVKEAKDFWDEHGDNLVGRGSL